jgi:DnaA family protein
MPDQPLEFSEAWSTLLFDDVDLWDEHLQAAAFNWLASMQSMLPESRPTVIAASQLPPADWVCRADLRTRLAQGLVLELRPLSEQQRIAVLQRAAAARGLALTDEVVAYMIRRFSRDLASLMLLLDHMDAYALEHQRALTVPLIKSMLEHS